MNPIERDEVRRLDGYVDGAGLSVVGVTKAFGGTVALDNVSLEAGAGRVHALLGSNGSGKSTLVKILAGVHQATNGGTVAVGADSIASTSITPADSTALGLRFVHQQLGLFPQLSIADNYAATAGFGGSPLSTIRRNELRRRTQDMLMQFRIDASPDDRVNRLRPSLQTMVAIGRAMSDRTLAKVLILDEPTEALPDDETSRLLTSIRELAATGMTFVIVSHRLAEIAEVADEATVLRDGVVVASALMKDLTRSDLVEHITGSRARKSAIVHRSDVGTDTVVHVDRMCVGSVRDLSFEVKTGEILGIAGLVGSGRSAVLEGIFAARPLRSGRVTIDGKIRDFRHPGDAIKAGVALVPENRVAQGLFLGQSVARNISAASLRTFFKKGSINRTSERSHGTARIGELGIKASSVDAAISSLSGGNQQKAIIARWLDTTPAVLLLDEPTQGVDVGARVEIHSIIRREVAKGMSVIIVSSDLDELCELSDRVLILTRGRLTHSIDDGITISRVAALIHQVG